MFNLFSKDIGIDLGTASVLVYIKGKGVVLREPSVVAMDKNTGKLLKVGTDAQAMLGRTPGNIVAMRPLREGVISDYDMTERMLKEFIKKVTTFSLFKPRLLICVPSGITEVEERAVVDAGIQAGARRAYLIEEPVAAAIGAGIDITKPDGHMVVDIGGGTADIAVISLGGVVESASIKIAGDKFDEAVVKYIRKKHNVLIGDRTAEELKMSIGCVFPRPEEVTMEIKGRCLMTGLPRVFSVSSSEMIEAFEEVSSRILEAIHGVLEENEHKSDDIRYLKQKVDSGVDFLTTQMFFDNDIHYNFLYRIREAGITVPVLPGIMPITSASQMKKSQELSGTVFPRRFLAILDRFGGSPAAMRQAGIAYATDQIIDLLANGVKNIHIYSMNRPDVATAIMSNLSEIIKV